MVPEKRGLQASDTDGDAGEKVNRIEGKAAGLTDGERPPLQPPIWPIRGHQRHERRTREDDERQEKGPGLRHQHVGHGATGLPRNLKGNRREQIENEQHRQKPRRPADP